MTSGAIHARIGGALVDVNEAIASFEARAALALIAPFDVSASCAVSARIIQAFIDVLIAVTAGEAQRTGAVVVVVV